MKSEADWEMRQKYAKCAIREPDSQTLLRCLRPMLNGVEWERLVAERRDSVAPSKSIEEIERETDFSKRSADRRVQNLARQDVGGAWR
jgi:hypothetical protein